MMQRPELAHKTTLRKDLQPDILYMRTGKWPTKRTAGFGSLRWSDQAMHLRLIRTE